MAGLAQHIQLKYIFGMNNEIRNSLQFHDEDRIIYPAGYNVVLHDLNDKSQHYYQGTNEYRGISCLALSPLKRYLALGVKGQRDPAIIIFDTFTQKRRKNLGLNLGNLDRYNIKQWVSIAFPSQNQETKYIFSLSGAGGDVVLCWWWHEKGKCLGSIDLGAQNDIYEISFNHSDANSICVTGNNFFGIYAKIEGTYVREDNQQKQKPSVQNGENSSAAQLPQPTLNIQVSAGNNNQNPQPEIKLENGNLISNLPADIVEKNFVAHLWMQCESYLVVFVESGEIILCDSRGNFLQIMEQSPRYFIVSRSGMIKIVAAVAYSKGFYVACSESIVLQYHYTQDNDKNPFTCVNQFKLKQFVELKEIEIKSICMNKAEDKLLIGLDNNQIYEIKIKPYHPETVNNDSSEDREVTLINHLNHTGPINSMDICKRKPIIATCSTDKTIKIWDYEKKQIKISWAFNEEAFCLSLHPQGFCVAVGFLDKLRLMNLCIHNSQNTTKNKAYKEISPFKGCKEIKFSNGGQYFAAVNSTSSNHVIQVFKFFTGENPSQLVFKGHTGRVKCIAWSSDDSFLLSCGLDGMILAWKLDQDFQHQQTIVPRIVDIHNKGVNFSGLTLTVDNKTIVAVGNDRHIHQAVINEQQPVDKTDKKLLDINLSCLAFPSSNKLLFAGIQDDARSSGAIRCFIYPLTHGKFTDYQAHDERGVEKMKITNDDRYIITAGKDGCIMVFEIKDKDARGMKLKDGYAKYSEEELITRSDLDDLKSTRDGLIVQINEFSNQNAMIGLNSRDDRIRQLETQIENNSQKRKQMFEQLLKSKTMEEQKLIQEINEIKEQFEQEIQVMDTKYQKEVMSLVEEYENQKRLHEIENNKNNKKKTKLLQEHSQKLQIIDDQYQKLLEEQITQKERVEKQINHLQKEQQEVLMQISEEKETEIKNLNQKNSKDEQAITDQGLKAKSDISITKKKIMQQQQEAQDLKEQKQEYERQKEKLKIQNQELRDKIDGQKKIILERDRTIGEKEKIIYNLKKKAQDLEKFKFVLDHKIKELKRDIVPREDEITKMKQETNNMDQYLKELNAYNNYLGTVVDELYTTQETMKEDIKQQRQQISVQQVKISRFKDDVYSLAQHILDYDKLVDETERLFMKHVNDKEVKRQSVEGDIMMEYRSQKKNLEKLVNMFKKSLQKDNQIHKDDKIRIMKDNVDLIREINTLRKSIKDITKGQQSNIPDQKGQTQHMPLQTPQLSRKSISQPVLPPISKSAMFEGVTQQNEIQKSHTQINPELVEEKQKVLNSLQTDILELQKVYEALNYEKHNLTQA
ncbi:WD40 domain protein (macronuclear) [Tetrahymena thermophila SB210]|uniref:Cilia- and flagella-associated protein 57 C n=1 Tax=Tetrahymena thermophila (strain SB210) TaxID=312017 RepID=CF57C_TETTS|nr:WD40 domain protein [Tetrahymena thermophila SB210]EWS71110.1 WD40 domain protein [Tetrahymena thermophila SB210]8TID_W Chain W, WD40 domain protein [Tetrahymena thermophila]|eukprot:XP_012656353.1 WD40 domain protein [Tetrahymena thermophila SB210]